MRLKKVPNTIRKVVALVLCMCILLYGNLNFVQAAGTATLTVSNSSVPVNGKIDVSIKDAQSPTNLKDWVGLYEDGDAPGKNTHSIWWDYILNLGVTDGNGSFTFDPAKIPADQKSRYTAGKKYKFIFAYNDSYTVSASASFNVTASQSPTITSIRHITVNTTAGTAPVLPSTVTADYSDGTNKEVSVTWDSIAASEYAQAGSFTVKGVVTSTGVVPKASVTVNEGSGPLLSFQVISDTHIRNTSSTDIYNLNLTATLEDLRQLNPSSNALIIAGDLTNSGTSTQYDQLESIMQSVSHATAYYVMGNHDIRDYTDYNTAKNMFLTKTGMSNNYYDFWINGYHFIVLGSDAISGDKAVISDTQLDWFKQALKENESSSKPIFVFVHQPLSNTVSGSNVMKDQQQDEQLKSILSQFPQTILFTGHTHSVFSEPTQFYSQQYCNMVNVPSTAYPWYDHTYTQPGKGAQGLCVDVYSNKVVVKGREFTRQEWIGQGTFLYNSTPPPITTGTISGTVTDGTNPIANANVSLTVSSDVYSAVTGQDGTYTITDVPTGNGYTLTASKTGFMEGYASNVTVEANMVTSGVDISLGVIPTPVFRTITVTNSPNGKISVDSTSVLEGETVSITIKPDSGYLLKPGTLKYNDGTDHVIIGTSFTMPAANVTVSAEFEKEPVIIDDEVMVAEDKVALTIGYSEGDSASSVMQNLALTTTGAIHCSDISWSSNNTAVISNSGVVTRPSDGSDDVTVTLTATITFGQASDTKDFSLVVLKHPQTIYTVTFDKNGGDIEANPTTMSAISGGNIGSLPTAPTRTGYTFSGWNMTANGTGTAFTATTVVNTDIKVYAQWAVVTNGSENDNNSGERTSAVITVVSPAIITETPATGNERPTVTATTTTEAKADSNGNAEASVTESQMTDAINKAVEAANKKGGDTQARVEIKVTASDDAKSVKTTIPKAAFAKVAEGKTDELTVSTQIGSMTFDVEALSKISVEMTGDVKITASKVDTKSLSEETKQTVGDRPVFNFSVTSGDKTISQFGGNVAVSVPYTPREGEDTNAIVIYYINTKGKPEMVSHCKYDQATGNVIFTTDHFSMYAVGYNKVSFKDVAANAWYSNAIEFVAARDITSGTGDGNFSPNAKLTRGQFLVMVMRAYGISVDENSEDNFEDAGSTYYTDYLGAAKNLGISDGIGNNLFAPEKEITRQEMFTLLYNVLKAVGELPQGTEGKILSSFSDADQIASWAKDAITLFVKTGTVSGSGGMISPASTTTRAEMAQVLYNLLSK